jgi:hypothetical protein
MAHLVRFINSGIAIILQSIEDGMLLCMIYDIRFLGEYFLLAIVEGAIQICLSGTGHVTYIVWTKEMVKQEYVNVLLDGFQGLGPVLVVVHGLLHSLLETHFMSLLVTVTAYQNQVDSVHHGLPLNSLQAFQIINIKLQVCNSPN